MYMINYPDPNPCLSMRVKDALAEKKTQLENR